MNETAVLLGIVALISLSAIGFASIYSYRIGKEDGRMEERADAAQAKINGRAVTRAQPQWPGIGHANTVPTSLLVSVNDHDTAWMPRIH